MTDLNKVSRKELLLHAVLLLRTVNRYQSKEEQLAEYDEYLSNEQLIDYITHFHDPQPEIDWDEEMSYEERYTPCASYGDYGPSNPWDAPGMSIHDFI